MHKNDWHFFGTFQPPINWYQNSKKFAAFIMSARYFRKKLVYILIHLIKNARDAVFIRHITLLCGQDFCFMDEFILVFSIAPKAIALELSQ